MLIEMFFQWVVPMEIDYILSPLFVFLASGIGAFVCATLQKRKHLITSIIQAVIILLFVFVMYIVVHYYPPLSLLTKIAIVLAATYACIRAPIYVFKKNV